MSLNLKMFNNMLIANAMNQGLPLSGAFELTSRCNFKCKMCYVACPANDRKAVSAEFSADKWIDMAKQARDAGLFYLILTGGEVFLRSDFQKIYEALCEMGLNITIYTNASLITAEKARWLGKIPPSKVSVTVYGASPKTYERVTGYPDGYMRTMRALDYLKAENIDLEIKTTVVEGNCREYEKIMKIAEGYSCGLGIVNYISPRREGSGSDPMGNRLTPAEIVNYERCAKEYSGRVYSKEKGQEVKIDDDTMENKLNIPDEVIKKYEKSAFRCQSGKTGFWITWDGRMIPCGLLDTPVSRPFEMGFANAWEKLKNECMLVPKCSDCISCDIREECNACPGRLMTETGRFDKPASYLCETARYRALLKEKENEQLSKIAK